MSVDVLSSVLSCFQFVPGSGHKRNLCKMCQRKEHCHSNLTRSTNSIQQHAASCQPFSDDPIQTLLDQYTHTRPKVIPQPRHEAVTDLHKMPPRVAKRGIQGLTGTGGGTADTHVIKIRRLIITLHGITTVCIPTMFIKCINSTLYGY